MKTCIFCAKDLSGKNRAREHIVSQHMLDEFQLRQVIVNHSQFSIVKPGFHGGHISVQTVERSPRFSSFLAGKVCASCNNGWMNRLEIATRPYLYPLIRGESELRQLNQKQMHELACWYLKTSVALSNSIGNDRFIMPQAHCMELYSHEGTKLPSGVAVFAAPAKRSDFVWSLCPTWKILTTATLDNVLEDQYRRAYKVFFQFGKLMLLSVYWPHTHRLYTYEDWGIHPIGGQEFCLRVAEDCRSFFSEDYAAFMIGVGTLLGLEDQLMKVSRNDVCPCGSGFKYKKCHGRA